MDVARRSSANYHGKEGERCGRKAIPCAIRLNKSKPRSRFWLDAGFFQEAQCAGHVLVVQGCDHHEPVGQRPYAQSADLGHACKAVHENVVIWGLDGRLKILNTERPVREDLCLQIPVEQAAQRYNRSCGRACKSSWAKRAL